MTGKCLSLCKFTALSLINIYITAGFISGQLPVRPSKIVAGHEPDKTNEFLQAMGTAILNKVSLHLL